MVLQDASGTFIHTVHPTFYLKKLFARRGSVVFIWDFPQGLRASWRD